MKYYRRLCNGVGKVGSFYPAEESVYDHIDNLDTDWYSSVYLYTEDQMKEALTKIEVTNKNTGEVYERKRGVGNITNVEGKIFSTMDNVHSDMLVFDFDSDKISDSKKDAIKLIERLEGDYSISPDDVEIFFSGGKGFGLQVRFKSELEPTELKSICTYLAHDLDTFDTKIYNPSRILRVPLTKHKSGLYKIPLTFDDLKDYKVKEIKKTAEVNFNPEIMKEFNPIVKTDKLEDIKANMPKIVKNKNQYLEEQCKDINDIDFTKKPPYLSAAKYVLEMGFIPRGYGQDARMILAASYRKAGKLANQAYYQLKATSENRVNIYGPQAAFDKDEMWNNVIATVYSDSWQGGTYNESHPLLFEIEDMLPAHLKRKDRSQLVENDSIFSKFKKFAIDIEKNTLKFGIPSLDSKLQLLTGTSVSILGVPGSGKSTLAMNLLRNNSLCGEKSIFYSLDMSESLVALKQVQMKTGLGNDAIYSMVKEDPERFKRIEDKVQDEFKNVEFSFRFGLSPDDIRNDIIDYEEKSGEKVRLVVVDYLESVTSPTQSDPVMAAGVVAQHLSNVASELDVLMVILMQTQKSRSPGEEIDSMRYIKGASVIEQSISVGIGVSREAQPLKYQDYDVSMTVNVLKNRYGGLTKTVCGWTGAKSSVHELTKDEKLILQELKDVKAAEAEEEAENNRGRGMGW